MPYLVIVSGAPASGKTTLSRRLETDLKIPLIAKDDIKESLFEHLPQYDRDWSTIEGRMAIAMMYAGAEALLREGYHVMIESSFNNEFSLPDVDSLIHTTDANVVEVYCLVDDVVRQERWTERSRSVDRHPGHLDDPFQEISQRTHAPLYPDKAILFDTGTESSVYEARYAEIVRELTSMLGQGGRYRIVN